MKPPRRIFRSSLTARTGRVSRALALWTSAAVGTSGLVMVGQSSDLFGRAQPGPDHVQAAPGQVAVVDGETLRLDGRVIRLAGVQAPSRGDACGAGADCGGAASLALANLVRDHSVVCRLSGYDHLGRSYGVCDADGTDLSQAIIASGWARARAMDAGPMAPGLADTESQARRQRAGLWAVTVSR
jgi:endonuclease YncB( thermonuclease family)